MAIANGEENNLTFDLLTSGSVHAELLPWTVGLLASITAIGHVTIG